jgi:hypothetical protein
MIATFTSETFISDLLQIHSAPFAISAVFLLD